MKDKRIVCGIYSITNILTNKRYIGYSNNIKRRFNDHKWALRCNKHDNDYLQKAWNKYGENGFIFEILEECIENELSVKEDYWCRYYKTHNDLFGYNLQITGITQKGPIKDSTKLKRSKSLKGRIFTKEHCENISKARLGKYTGPNPYLKQRQREVQGYPIIVISLYNEKLYEFNSIAETSEKLNLKAVSIAACIKNPPKCLKGYIFIKKEEYDENKDYTIGNRNIKSMRIKYAK